MTVTRESILADCEKNLKGVDSAKVADIIWSIYSSDNREEMIGTIKGLTEGEEEQEFIDKIARLVDHYDSK